MEWYELTSNDKEFNKGIPMYFNDYEEASDYINREEYTRFRLVMGHWYTEHGRILELPNFYVG